MSLESSKRIETNTHQLVVKVSKEDFQEEVTKVFRKASKDIQIAGFRKGKAPRPVVENIYGKDFLWEDAVNNLYPKKYKLAADEAKIEPVDSAEIDISDLSEDGFTFTATVTVKPEVKISSYKKLKAERIIKHANEKDVQAELDEFIDRGARMIPVEDRAAKKDDTANIDFEGFKDGVPFEGGKGENFDLVLGSGQFIPGFEEQVIGQKIADEFDVELSFPEEYHVKELKGQPVVFKVKINGLTMKELPELDDEFAKDISEFDTLEELKEDILKNIQKKNDENSDKVLEDALMDQVAKNLEAEIPPIMFERRIDDMVRDFEQNLAQQNMNLELYLQYTNSDMKAFREGFDDQANRQVRVQLALEEIARKEKIEPTEEDFEEHYKKISEGYGMEPDMIKSIIPKDQIESEIKLNKSIDVVRESANIKDVSQEEADKTAQKEKKAVEKKDKAKKNEEEPKEKEKIEKKPSKDKKEPKKEKKDKKNKEDK